MLGDVRRRGKSHHENESLMRLAAGQVGRDTAAERLAHDDDPLRRDLALLDQPVIGGVGGVVTALLTRRAPALAEARKNSWTMAVAIVDTGGTLVYFEKLDNTQSGSAQVAINKARSAAQFKRPTKAFQDALAAGGEGLRILRIDGAVPVEGGIPLVMDGKIVGAIGVSGGTSAQDNQSAKAGADALK